MRHFSQEKYAGVVKVIAYNICCCKAEELCPPNLHYIGLHPYSSLEVLPAPSGEYEQDNDGALCQAPPCGKGCGERYFTDSSVTVHEMVSTDPPYFAVEPSELNLDTLSVGHMVSGCKATSTGGFSLSNFDNEGEFCIINESVFKTLTYFINCESLSQDLHLSVDKTCPPRKFSYFANNIQPQTRAYRTFGRSKGFYGPVSFPLDITNYYYDLFFFSVIGNFFFTSNIPTPCKLQSC
jgi:hypothetical protein